MKWIVKRFGDDFKSVKWHEKNKWKVTWTVGMPLMNIWTPAVEELIFRAPLIIAFSTMSSFAWYGVLTSSCLFALVHWFGKKIWMPEILLARENGDYKSDDLKAETERLRKEEGKEILVKRVLHVILTLPLGILAGYYGIKYQSVWVSVGIHSLWNLIIPMVLPLLVIFGLLIFLGVLSLWDRVAWRRRW